MDEGACPEVLILGGFLGSGKTTLLLRLAEYLSRMSDTEVPVAFIENEIGEVGLDDVIGGGGYAMRSLLSGCACCTLKGELHQAVREIAAGLSPEVIVVEATGVAVPSDIAAGLIEELGIKARLRPSDRNAMLSITIITITRTSLWFTSKALSELTSWYASMKVRP